MVLGRVEVVMNEPEVRELRDTSPWPVAVFPSVDKQVLELGLRNALRGLKRPQP